MRDPIDKLSWDDFRIIRAVGRNGALAPVGEVRGRWRLDGAMSARARPGAGGVCRALPRPCRRRAVLSRSLTRGGLDRSSAPRDASVQLAPHLAFAVVRQS